jgi:hypothetical protein
VTSLSSAAPDDDVLKTCAPPTAGTAATAAQLVLWDQCGGVGGSCQGLGACVDGPYPGKACPPGASCQRQSEWYWQCHPADSGSQPSGEESRAAGGRAPHILRPALMAHTIDMRRLGDTRSDPVLTCSLLHLPARRRQPLRQPLLRHLNLRRHHQAGAPRRPGPRPRSGRRFLPQAARRRSHPARRGGAGGGPLAGRQRWGAHILNPEP